MTAKEEKLFFQKQFYGIDYSSIDCRSQISTMNLYQGPKCAFPVQSFSESNNDKYYELSTMSEDAPAPFYGAHILGTSTLRIFDALMDDSYDKEVHASLVPSTWTTDAIEGHIKTLLNLLPRKLDCIVFVNDGLFKIDQILAAVGAVTKGTIIRVIPALMARFLYITHNIKPTINENQNIVILTKVSDLSDFHVLQRKNSIYNFHHEFLGWPANVSAVFEKYIGKYVAGSGKDAAAVAASGGVNGKAVILYDELNTKIKDEIISKCSGIEVMPFLCQKWNEMLLGGGLNKASTVLSEAYKLEMDVKDFTIGCQMNIGQKSGNDGEKTILISVGTTIPLKFSRDVPLEKQVKIRSNPTTVFKERTHKRLMNPFFSQILPKDMYSLAVEIEENGVENVIITKVDGTPIPMEESKKDSPQKSKQAASKLGIKQEERKMPQEKDTVLPPRISKDTVPPPLSKDTVPPPLSKDTVPPPTSEDTVPPSPQPTKDTVPPPTFKDTVTPQPSKDTVPPSSATPNPKPSTTVISEKSSTASTTVIPANSVVLASSESRPEKRHLSPPPQPPSLKRSKSPEDNQNYEQERQVPQNKPLPPLFLSLQQREKSPIIDSQFQQSSSSKSQHFNASAHQQENEKSSRQPKQQQPQKQQQKSSKSRSPDHQGGGGENHQSLIPQKSSTEESRSQLSPTISPEVAEQKSLICPNPTAEFMICLNERHCCICLPAEGNTTTRITNINGNKWTPMYVSFLKSPPAFGEVAKADMDVNPEGVIFDICQFISVPYKDITINSEWGFGVAYTGKKIQQTVLEVLTWKGIHAVDPINILAIVIIGLHKEAERVAGKSLKRVFIKKTKPVGKEEAAAIKEAVKIARLECAGIETMPNIFVE